MTMTTKTPPLTEWQTRASTWFKSLQLDICARFEALEDAAAPPLYRGEAGRFELKEWSRGDGSEDLGGGRMGHSAFAVAPVRATGTAARAAACSGERRSRAMSFE